MGPDRDGDQPTTTDYALSRLTGMVARIPVSVKATVDSAQAERGGGVLAGGGRGDLDAGAPPARGARAVHAGSLRYHCVRANGAG